MPILINDGLADVVFGAEATGCSGSAFVYLSSPSYHSYAIPGPLSNSSPVGYGSAASSVPGPRIVLAGDKWWTGPSGIQSGQVYVYTVN